MLGISTSFFAVQRKGFLHSVSSCIELGFECIEIGAAHSFEPGIWGKLKALRRDFPGKAFTVHGFFPPLEKPFWFNPGEGLTPANRKIVENLFRAAEMVEALCVSFHPGFRFHVRFSGPEHGFDFPTKLQRIPLERAFKNAFNVAAFAAGLSRSSGVPFAVENLSSLGVQPLFDSVKDYERLFEAVPETSLLFDVGHSLSRGNFEEMISLREKIVEVHLHDSALSKDHLPLLEGVLGEERLKRVLSLRVPQVFEFFPPTTVEKVKGQLQLVKGLREQL